MCGSLCQISCLFFCLGTLRILFKLPWCRSMLSKRPFHSHQRRTIHLISVHFSKWLLFPPYRHGVPSPLSVATSSGQIHRTDSHHKNVPHHLEKYSLVGASDSEFQKIFFRCLSFNETQDIYCQVVPMLIFELSLCYHLFAQNTALCYSAFLFAYISVEHS